MSEQTKPNRLEIQAATDGGYLVVEPALERGMLSGLLFAGSLKEALAYIEGRFDVEAKGRCRAPSLAEELAAHIGEAF